MDKPIKSKFRPFVEARSYVSKFGFSNREEYMLWARSDVKPVDIPNYPNDVYKDEWVSWGDWLGTGIVGNRNKKFLSFTLAREFARKLNLNSRKEWSIYLKEAGIKNIPLSPSRHYLLEWQGWNDWLSSSPTVDFLSYNLAVAEVKTLKIKSINEWREYCQRRVS